MAQLAEAFVPPSLAAPLLAATTHATARQQQRIRASSLQRSSQAAPAQGAGAATATAAAVAAATTLGGRAAAQRRRRRLTTGGLTGCHAARRVMSLENGAGEDAPTRRAIGHQSKAERENCYLHKLGEAEAQKLAELRAMATSIVAGVLEEWPSWRPELWGIDMRERSEASDVLLLKFLRAADVDVGRAGERLRDTLRFRAEEKIGQLAGANLPDHFLGHDIISGPDVDGRPVMISRYGQMDNDRVFGDTDAFVKYRLQVMEKAMAELNFASGEPEDLCQVHDYSGVSLLFKTPEVKAGVAAMTKVFSDHYPETKGKTIFVNFPGVFSKLFQAFSVFIPERTRKKFLILAEDDQEGLFRQISPTKVPEALGGLLRPVEDAEARAQLTATPQVVTVGPRTSREVDLLEFHEPGQSSWELRVCALDLSSYELRFFPKGSSSGSSEEASGEIVASSQGLKASEGVISGTFRASQAGTLRCRFNNESSWLRSKTCLCRAQLS
eukprot:TRINITY_DN31033_c0_g1_i2.p1 TRINITY_DN31033_c0_g1~~TRINITY_DN31033_c0_g1_i2.p1  ORF type:complete len:498 (+),score=95.28 TRINITY_DN31033_c0_g1_i2:39-1532(+)